MKQELFRPNWKQAAILVALVAGSIAYAAALRYLAIEKSAVALACDAGASGWLCSGRKVVLAFSQTSAFGLIALGAAALNLMRPSIVLSAVALVAASFGLVLYNTATSAVAVGLLTLGLARPVPEPE